MPSHPDYPYAPIDGLRIIVSERRSTTSIELNGDLDLAAREASRAAVTRAVGSAPECIVLDLSRVSFIDATGVSVVVELAERCAGQRVRLVIVPGPRAVQRVFDLCGLVRQLPFIGQAGPRPSREIPDRPSPAMRDLAALSPPAPSGAGRPRPTLATGAAPDSTASSAWGC